MKPRHMKNVFHYDSQEAWKQYFIVILLTDSSTDSAIKILTFIVLGSKVLAIISVFPILGTGEYYKCHIEG